MIRCSRRIWNRLISLVLVIGTVGLAGFGGLAGNAATAASWSAQTITGPPLANGQLLAVWCRSAAACVAVGYYTDSQGVQVPLAERWDGRRWSADRVPALSSGTAGSLAAVSCSSTSACTAVGGYIDAEGHPAMLVEGWNGRVWSIEGAPGPSDAAKLSLNGVACPSLRLCLAVGSFTDAANRQHALLEQWDGARWSLAPLPSPTRDNAVALSGVSCSSPNACTIIGAAGANTVDTPLAERWNGTHWSLEQTPKLQGTGGLSGVTCVSNTACFAVGSVTTPSQYRGGTTSTLAERWVNGQWSIQGTPNPHLPGPDPNPQVTVKLAAISCSSLRACTAVGSSDSLAPGDDNIDDHSELLVERWNGTRWVGQTAPQPPFNPATQAYNDRPAFSGVSCGSPTMCIAVGPVSNVPDPQLLNPSVQTTLAERWNGRVWQIQDTANGVGTSGGNLKSVSCPAATTCFAVGGSDPPASTPPLAERWDGVGWTIMPTPAKGALDAIACTSAHNCTAVGGGLIEHWNGSAWTSQSWPKASAPYINAISVSCPSATFCAAIGAWSVAGVPSLVAIWSGTKWTIQDTRPGGYLDAISCTSRTFCQTVGETSDGHATFAESWNGSTWTVQPTPIAVGTTFAQLSGVSCTSPASCTAVGWFGKQQFDNRQLSTLVERWDGSSWKIQSSPNAPDDGPNSFGSSLQSVSCTTASSCMAAGESGVQPYSSGTDSLAESWNGTTWTIQSPPNRGPLQGVSCSEAAACTAVGSRGQNTFPATLPTALRYG